MVNIFDCKIPGVTVNTVNGCKNYRGRWLRRHHTDGEQVILSLRHCVDCGWCPTDQQTIIKNRITNLKTKMRRRFTTMEFNEKEAIKVGS